MGMEFQYVLAGEGMGCRKEQGKAGIEGLPVGIPEVPERCDTRLGAKADYRLCDGPGGRPGDPDDTHATPTCRRGPGNDGVNG